LQELFQKRRLEVKKKTHDVASQYGLDLRESILFYQLEALEVATSVSDWELSLCVREFIKQFDAERNASGLLLYC
jgi:hypothetical protein